MIVTSTARPNATPGKLDPAGLSAACARAAKLHEWQARWQQEDKGKTWLRRHALITEDIPNRVAADKAYQNARQNSDKQNARIGHDKDHI